MITTRRDVCGNVVKIPVGLLCFDSNFSAIVDTANSKRNMFGRRIIVLSTPYIHPSTPIYQGTFHAYLSVLGFSLGLRDGQGQTQLLLFLCLPIYTPYTPYLHSIYTCRTSLSLASASDCEMARARASSSSSFSSSSVFRAGGALGNKRYVSTANSQRHAIHTRRCSRTLRTREVPYEIMMRHTYLLASQYNGNSMKCS